MATLRGLGYVRVGKSFLVEKLNENRKLHKEMYEDAVEGWHVKAIKRLQKELRKLKADNSKSVYLSLQRPTSHIKEYDRVLDMLEASLDEEFELSDKEFSQYVRDEWSWKTDFITTVSGTVADFSKYNLDK
jgi:hypothetical protein